MNKSVLTCFAIIALSSCLFAQTTSSSPYCNAGFDDDPFPVDDAIFGVTLGTLNNQSNVQSAAPHYIYYNNLTTPSLVKGSQYTLSVKFDVQGGVGIGAWIDYNHNNVFETSEKILNNPAGGVPLGATTQTINFTIPTSATAGTTRMRVRIVEDDNYNMTHNYVIVPCNASTSSTDVMDWGETEDYNINIVTSTEIKEADNDLSFISFPNPVENVLSINDVEQKINALSIKTINGTLLETLFLKENNLFSADVSLLPAGVYFIEVVSKGKIYYKKFIKL